MSIIRMRAVTDTDAAVCERCGVAYNDAPEQDRALWNMETKGGYVVGDLCGSCQTPDESAEAEINQATLDYAVTPDGRSVAKPKTEVLATAAAAAQIVGVPDEDQRQRLLTLTERLDRLRCSGCRTEYRKASQAGRENWRVLDDGTYCERCLRRKVDNDENLQVVAIPNDDGEHPTVDVASVFWMQINGE
jgi:hypothetical protein